jgi:phosphatidylserine/phosphatidylglycerophosphate/cardiolipin synthase-like enzyme
MTDLSKLLDEIQKPEISHVDMYKRRAKGTLQWFLERDCKTHPIHNNNDLKFFMCGEEGFTAIEADIRAATTSIDLVLWGFDPGMELVRKGSVWPRGTTYGDLLTAKAREGVKVRLLVWYAGDIPFINVVAGATGNVPDIGHMSGLPLRSSEAQLKAPAPTDSPRNWTLTDRKNYCKAWWKKALHGAFPNLEIRLRATHPDAIKRQAQKYLPESAKSFTERGGMKFVATHHQKPVLIDYGAVGSGKKSNTCGYVMGLNSVTDYWDTFEHPFNNPQRELSPAWSDLTPPWHLKPYRDYAIRIEGEALFNLNENFVQGWDNADGYGLANAAPKAGPRLADERKAIQAKDLPRPAGARCRTQILRTYPDSDDATILKAYTLASANAVNYIYVENQYFQLSEWPKLLKKIRSQYQAGMIAAGAAPGELTPLHVVVVMPQPERDQMVPNTYDTLNQLGQTQNMSAYDKQVQGQRKAQEASALSQVGMAGLKAVLAPASVVSDAAKQTVMQDSIDAAPTNPTGELSALGLKALAVMLMTYDYNNEARNIRISARDSNAQTAQAKQQEETNDSPKKKEDKINKGKANDVDAENLSEHNIKPGRYREIYIHSKLMFVDDVYTTLGSANLNARSMVGDSELNICTEEYAFTKAARKRVWGNLAGADLDGKACSLEDMKATFEGWKERMRVNKLARNAGDAPENNSFIHPFEDPRGAPTVRLA